MKSLKSLCLFITIISVLSIKAEVQFNKYFCDSTLRLDYIYAGNAHESHIFLSDMHKANGWAGRRHNLDKLPYRGNGIITVRDSLSGDTIYRISFSTLFREWQCTDEATTASKAFQNTLLVPMPLRAATITVELMDARQEVAATNTCQYHPGDILIKENPAANNAPHRYLRYSGDPKSKIDVAILAEGYVADSVEHFYADAERAVKAILNHEPFKSRANEFNFIAVATPSQESGVSVPRTGNWKDTSFGSNFDTFYSVRYLTTANVWDIHDAIAHVPYEHIIILANSKVYGGGGIYNSYTLTTTGHAKYEPVVVHEFGHSFGGLADEYFYNGEEMEDSYPLNIEPWEPNITTLVDFDSKWKTLIKADTPVPTPREDANKYDVGVFEGGGYSFKGIYSPADRCRMRDNEWSGFCPACQHALNRLIDFYVK